MMLSFLGWHGTPLEGKKETLKRATTTWLVWKVSRNEKVDVKISRRFWSRPPRRRKRRKTRNRFRAVMEKWAVSAVKRSWRTGRRCSSNGGPTSRSVLETWAAWFGGREFRSRCGVKCGSFWAGARRTRRCWTSIKCSVCRTRCGSRPFPRTSPGHFRPMSISSRPGVRDRINCFGWSKRSPIMIRRRDTARVCPLLLQRFCSRYLSFIPWFDQSINQSINQSIEWIV